MREKQRSGEAESGEKNSGRKGAIGKAKIGDMKAGAEENEEGWKTDSEDEWVKVEAGSGMREKS